MGNEVPGTHAPWRATATFSFPRAPRGEERGCWTWVTPPFWKLPAGAGSRAGREARRDIRARRTPSAVGRRKSGGGRSGGGRSLGSSWSQQPVENEPVWFVGACSRWRVRASRRRRGLEAQLCQLCHGNLRVRVGRAGESSPAAWQSPSSTAATLAAVGTGRRDSPHQGTTRVQVTCTVSRDSFGLPSPTP